MATLLGVSYLAIGHCNLSIRTSIYVVDTYRSKCNNVPHLHTHYQSHTHIIIDELIQKHGLTYDQVNARLRQTHLLAEKIGVWENIAESLELTKPEIIGIKRDGYDESEKKKLMLDKWVDKCGSDATVKALIDACLSVKETEVAENICLFIVSFIHL